MLYRAPVDTSPVTEGVTLFKYQLLLLLYSTEFSSLSSAIVWTSAVIVTSECA